MSYRYDNDLEFLGRCTNEELKELFDLLVYDPKDGEQRVTSTLTYSEEYKKYGTDYSKYWRRIAEELQLYGGNTVVNNFIRFGSGVTYREILQDVAKTLKVPFDKIASTEEIEFVVLEKILSEIFAKVSPEEAKKIFSDLSNDEIVLKYKNSAIDVNSAQLEKLTFLLLNKGLTRIIGGILAGPIGLLLNALIIADIAGPATRVTIPAVMLIATLRRKKIQNLQMPM